MTSQTTTSQTSSQIWDIRGKNLPTPKGKGYVYTYPLPLCEVFWEVSPTPVSPRLGGWEVFWEVCVLTAALIAAGMYLAGISQTMPNYEKSNLPDNGSVRESYTGLTAPVAGPFVGVQTMNQKDGNTSPRPWHIERRIMKSTKTCHHPRPQYHLVDANGRAVWHTEANMRLICDCVNKAVNQ